MMATRRRTYLGDVGGGTGLRPCRGTDTHASLQHEAVLVLPRVAVKRRSQCAWRHRWLKAREALARLGAVNQEANTDTAEKDFVAARWPDHLHASASASILIPFLGQRRHPPQERISRTATDQAL